MRYYETPKIKVIELETSDIIQTSGTLIPGGTGSVPGTGTVVPTPGNQPNSLNTNY